MKKLLLGLGAISATITPILAVVACGATDNTAKYATTNIAKVEELSKTAAYKEKITKAIKDKKIATGNMLLITASGEINDSSFNQSIWEAVSILSNQLGSKASNFIENTDASNLGKSYNNAINQDAKYWILTGHGQKKAIKSWLDNVANKKQFIAKKIIIIGTDWVPDKGVIPDGQSITVNFKTEQAGWIVGYAAAQYVVETQTDPDERTLSGFGGGAYGGVTDFLSGYLTGIHAYNKDNPKKKVKFKTGHKDKKGKDSILLTAGFAPTNGNKVQIQKIVATKAKIILPVAGALTIDTIEAIKKATKIVQNMIGVDSDQSLAFPNDKGIIFSSIEKKVGITIYKAMASLYLKDYTFLDGFVPIGDDKAKNVDIKKGILDDFVGVSQTTTKTEKIKALVALKAATTKYEAKRAEINEAIALVLASKAPKEKSIQVLLDKLITKINS